MSEEMKCDWAEWCEFNEANSQWWEQMDGEIDEQCFNEDEV